MDDMNKTIEIPFEMIDQIVVDEIKQALEMNVELQRDEGGTLIEPDVELIDALRVCLRYFAAHSDYEPFLRNLALTELVRNAELLGLYDEPPIPIAKHEGP